MTRHAVSGHKLGKIYGVEDTPPWVETTTMPVDVESLEPTAKCYDTQIGGNHYKRMEIQPITYITENNLSFLEGSVIKYVSRWKFKNGIEDLKKAKHCLELLIATEETGDY